MNKKYKIIAAVFIVLQIITLVMNFVTIFYVGISENQLFNAWSVIILNVITLVAFALSYFDFNIARYIQPFTLILNGYHSFVMDGFDMFFGWGLFLMGILLGYEYGIWKKNFKLKFLGLALSYVVIVILSGLVSGDYISTFLSSCVFMTFIIFFAVVIYRNQIEVFFKLRQDYRKIADELIQKQIALSDLEEQLETAETELQRMETQKSMKESISSITDDINTLTNRIRAIPGFTNLSELDLNMLVTFYVSRGNKTNKELGYDIGKDENYVKNHLRSIYSSVPEVNSRAGLLVYISDCLDF